MFGIISNIHRSLMQHGRSMYLFAATISWNNMVLNRAFTNQTTQLRTPGREGGIPDTVRVCYTGGRDSRRVDKSSYRVRPIGLLCQGAVLISFLCRLLLWMQSREAEYPLWSLPADQWCLLTGPSDSGISGQALSL